MMAVELSEIELNEANYISLLRDLISVSEKVQNAPSLGLIPQENFVSDFVLKKLQPFVESGQLQVERVEFQPNRGHLVIKVPGQDLNQTVAFVGSHMDVVPANPEGWERDPFTLAVEGDFLYGRGTTDCLGHVALLTEMLVEICTNKIQLKKTLAVVMIVAEENTDILNVGVDKLMESGKIDFLKNGPVVWVDTSDSQPNIGTAGALTWTLKATGKLFHSGLPHLAINSMELAMDALSYIQKRFYEDFPAHPMEAKYNFACGSTMKPTCVEGSVNGLNQIPPWCKIMGDVRLSPFYEVLDLKKKLTEYVAELNADITQLEGGRGAHSKYTLPEENKSGLLEISFGAHYMEGIACSLESIGFKALDEAIAHVKGKSVPFSIMGSLPLVRDLQRAGFDLTLTGFGKSTVYHGDNEYCLLSDMKDAMKILCRTVQTVNDNN